MSNISSTKGTMTEFAGDYKVVRVYCTPVSASDTVVLTASTHGVTDILTIIPVISSGQNVSCSNVYASWSGATITVVTSNATGTAATYWTGVVVDLLVIAK